MKMNILFKDRIFNGAPITALCACIVLAGASPLFAGEAAKTIVPAAEDNFNNWVDVGTGATFYKGNAAQGQQRTGNRDGMFGGINDMHVEQTLGDKWFAKLDGRAIFGNHDYDLTLDISKPDVGYIRAGFKDSRTYYNGMGGFYPNKNLPGDGVMVQPLSDELYVDRGDVWTEFGLRAPSLPEITLRYDHIWREGTKDSTIWGDLGYPLTGANLLANNTRKIVPSFRTINERRDVIALDVKKNIGKTDVSVGARGEFINNNDSLNSLLTPGQYNTTLIYKDVKLDRYLTQEDALKSDTFSTHATTETRFGEKLWLTSAYAFTTLNSDIGGSRIYGQDYDSAYRGIYGATLYRNLLYPVALQSLPLAATSTGNGYYNLGGGSEVQQHEFNVNLMWIPIKDLSIITGFRFDQEDTDSVSTYTQTGYNTKAGAYYISGGSTKTVTYIQPTLDPWTASSSYKLQKLAENLEIRYTGLKDWVFYTRCDLDEDEQDVIQFQKNAILSQQYQLINGVLKPTIQTPGSLTSGTVTRNDAWTAERMITKYTVGSNWYPLPRLSFSAQYYHKTDENDYSHKSGDPFTYMNNQTFTTDNVNFRMTVRPLNNLSLVSRYDFQRIASDTDVGVPASSAGSDGSTPITQLGPQQSAIQQSHMFSECITWNPLDRLYVQGNFTYVMNKTATDAAITIQDPTLFKVDPKTGLPVITGSTGLPTVPTYANGNPVIGPINLSYKNNYWTAGLGVGFALNDKTDLRADYTYFRANDYGNNALFGQSVVISQPFGTGQEEQTVSMSVQRQLCRNARLTLKYAFTSSRDEASYGYGNFVSQQISTSVMVRF